MTGLQKHLRVISWAFWIGLAAMVLYVAYKPYIHIWWWQLTK